MKPYILLFPAQETRGLDRALEFLILGYFQQIRLPPTLVAVVEAAQFMATKHH
jgi:hypothetical protein